MPINWNALEREEQYLEEQLAEGRISQKEFNKQMRDLQDDVRGAAEEDAERAYNDAMGG